MTYCKPSFFFKVFLCNKIGCFSLKKIMNKYTYSSKKIYNPSGTHNIWIYLNVLRYIYIMRFFQLFNWFQLFFSDKNILNIAGYGQNRYIYKKDLLKVGVDCSSYFSHWFSVILFSSQNHPCMYIYIYIYIYIFFFFGIGIINLL